MPQIRQYQQHVGTPSPSFVESNAGAVGRVQAEATADLGKTLENATARLDAFEEQQENSKMAADLSIAQARLTIKEKELALHTDPNLYPEAAKKFLEEDVQQTLDGIGQNLKTRGAQQRFQEASAHIKAGFQVNTASTGAEKAGQAASDNWTVTVNSLTSSTMQNPVMFEANNSLMEHTIQGITTLDDHQKKLLLQDGYKKNAISQVYGIADTNPEAAKALLDSGRHDEYINGVEKKNLYEHIQSEQDKIERQKTAAEVARKKAEKEDAEKQEIGIMQHIYDPASGLHVSAQDFADFKALGDHPGMDAAEYRSGWNFLVEAQKNEVTGRKPTTDNRTYAAFSARMFKGTNGLTMQEVYDAYAERQLSDEDFQFFRSAVNEAASSPQKSEQNKRLSEVQEGFKSLITRSNLLSGQIDAAGDEQYLYFLQESRQAYEDGLAKGKSLTDITEEIRGLADSRKLGLTKTRQLMMGRIKEGSKSLGRSINAPPPVNPKTTLPKGTPAVKKPGSLTEEFFKKQGQ